MEVETYEVTEQTTEGKDSFEIDAEAQTLIEELGLEGQQALLVPSEDPDVATQTRVPYQQMTRAEIRVYETLYPEQTKVEAYKSGPIPLRVLQVIAHARTMFDTLTIWHPQTSDPDPVLVGTMKRPGDFGDTHDHFMLARWGDALEPFEDLYERALEVVTKKWKAKAESVAAECMSFMDAPTALVREHLSGEWVHGPWT